MSATVDDEHHERTSIYKRGGLAIRQASCPVYISSIDVYGVANEGDYTELATDVSTVYYCLPLGCGQMQMLALT